MRCVNCVKCAAIVGCLVLAAGVLVMLLWQFPFETKTARPETN